MNTPAHVPLSRLTRALYADFLACAQASGFAFVRFPDLRPGAPAPSAPFIALRHDIDFAPGYSLAMAELEHEAGVTSTFFVLVDGRFYNPLDPTVVRQIRRIHALGHEIGLHIAVSSAVGDDLAEEVAFRLDVLSAIVGAPVRCLSQHDPVNAGFTELRLPAGRPPCVDAYAAIAAHDLLYVSDSAMKWREHTFHTALETGRNLCLLAHPHSWLHPEDDYVAMIRDLEAGQQARVSEPFDAFVDALAGYYERRAREGV